MLTDDEALGLVVGAVEAPPSIRLDVLHRLVEELDEDQWRILSEQVVALALVPPGAPWRAELILLLARRPSSRARKALEALALDQRDPDRLTAELALSHLDASPPATTKDRGREVGHAGSEVRLHRYDVDEYDVDADGLSDLGSIERRDDGSGRRLRGVRGAEFGSASRTGGGTPDSQPRRGRGDSGSVGTAAEVGGDAVPDAGGAEADSPPSRSSYPAHETGSHVGPPMDSPSPRLDAPASVQPGEEFVVTVGLQKHPDATLISSGPMALPLADIEIQVSLQFDPLAFALLTPPPTVTLRRTTLEPWPSAKFQLIARSSEALKDERRIDAKYLRNGSLIGFASRPLTIAVPGAARPGTNAPSVPSGPGPSNAPTGSAVSMLDLGPLLSENRADLELVVRPSADAGGTRLVFTANSRHIEIDDRPDSTTHTIMAEHERGVTPHRLGKEIRLKVSTTSDQNDLFAWLEGMGRRVYGSLPPQIRTALREAVASGTPEAPATVLIFTAEPHIPWELAVDPAGWPSAVATTSPFLGAHATISRWFLGDVEPPPRSPVPHLALHRKALVTAHYEGVGGTWEVLPYAEKEVADLEDLFAPDVTVVSPVFDDINDLLHGQPEAELIHFALHGKFDPQGIQGGIVLIGKTAAGEPAPQLLQEYHVDAGRLERTPFVYLNACQVATGDNQALGDYGGMAAAFLRAGAGGVLAPLWNVNDKTTSMLAKEFYERATGADPPSVAEIVRGFRARYTRQSVRDRVPGVDATLIAFQLFGHPCMKLTFTTTTTKEAAHA